MHQSPSPLTSEHYQNSLLIFLSGEQTSLPESEASALILTYDAHAEIRKAEDRIIIANTSAPPNLIAGRIAFARRVGILVPDGKLDDNQLQKLRSSSYRVRVFKTVQGKPNVDEIVSTVANQTHARVDLRNPEFEISVICGSKSYFALTKPDAIRHGWASRRPRSRAYFHPAAIFPKLARALVNLTRVKEGEVLLDPYVGTGSLLIEGSYVGAECVGVDLSKKMVKGSVANEKKAGQEWLGVARADSLNLPVNCIDALVTDVPYGRASSSEGNSTASHLQHLLSDMKSILKSGRRAVIMHPRPEEILSSGNLEVEEEHHIYVHRKLTRTVTVLRRK